MSSLSDTIQRIFPLSDRVLAQFTALFAAVDLPRGTHLFEAGRIAHEVYIIARGMARAYCYREGKDITFWFGAEGDVVLSYYSYVAGRPGYETVELLEDAALYRIDQHTLHGLFRDNIELANWGRKLAEYELIRTEERLISRQFHTARRRYDDLLRSNGRLIERVQLQHIASYLGVTQVTLSRIRAQAASKRRSF